MKLVRLPDGNAVIDETIRGVFAKPRTKKGGSAEVVIYLSDNPPMRIEMPHSPAAKHARDALLAQLDVPEFPAYEPAPGDDTEAEDPDDDSLSLLRASLAAGAEGVAGSDTDAEPIGS